VFCLSALGLFHLLEMVGVMMTSPYGWKVSSV
jgi:hypothetical protein